MTNQAQLLLSVFENSNAVIIIKNTEGKVLMVNHAFSQLFNVSEKAAIGKTASDFVPEPEVKLSQTNDQHVLSANKPLTFNESVHTPHGFRQFIAHRFPIFNIAGHDKALGFIGIDVTQTT